MSLLFLFQICQMLSAENVFALMMTQNKKNEIQHHYFYHDHQCTAKHVKRAQNKARLGNNWNQIGPAHSIVFPRNHTDLPFATFDHHQKVINNIWKREIVPTENVFSKKEYNEYRGYFARRIFFLQISVCLKTI